MMRAPRPRSIVLVCAAAAAILPASLAGATTGTTAHTTAKLAAPASAGKLTQGAIKYFWARGHAPKQAPTVSSGRAQAASVDTSNDLVYGGGPATGTISSQPAVYIVFWGSQWSQSDPYATYLQNFLKGLYTTGDSWTHVADQYCEGSPAIAAGATSCPSTGVTHVGSPSGSLVKGVWFDNALPAVPYTSGLLNFPTADAMASEAVTAAQHFGNTTAASNVNTQYVIALPSHTPPPGFGYYCAYHSSVSSNYGDVAYTNLPYLTDVSSLCGENAVNSGSGGTYDGVSIVEGHEYMETITDMRPRSGWTDASGQENGDKCAWITSGQGAMANITTTTGKFAVQSTWSNALNNGSGGCAISG
jgi:serine protease